MKMIIATVFIDKRQEISKALIKANFRVTQLSTTSGILRGGETSLMIGVEDDQVDEALQIIREQIPESPNHKETQATLYVLNVKNFNRL